ncbi:MAG TPA: AI-2E family transporter [Candidatus Limnocylindria bacterium]|nr:AI-2E family transporter [Candidatus Limnocylindria bacterium]
MADLLGALRRHRLAIFALAMIVLVAWLLWTARGALPAFFIGLALAFVLDPGVTRLQRLGVPRWGGVLAMYALVVALVWLVIAFALPPIATQSREFLDHLPQLGASIGDVERGIEDWYRSLPLPPELRTMVDASVARGQEALATVVQSIIGPTLGTLLRTATFLLGLVVIPVWLFFVLKDREAFPRAVAGALPPTWRPDGENLLGILARVGGRWVRGQLLLGGAVFLATAIGLTILTLIGFGEFGQFALVLALIAGILEWFPIIGPIIAAIPALLVALTVSPAAVVAIVIVYTGIQQLENNLLVPKVMGDAVDLHPAVVILALVVGGALFGIGGAILAAPTVAAGRDLYRYGFHRLSGQPPSEAFQLAVHGHLPVPEVDDTEATEAELDSRARAPGDE